ncbi:hypothetical protein F2Q70_00011341 [Brassica cretica]|uniref:Uncharacterized protein n=1 Tax=Brassica cretica TaxID=69181 RepID=A0A8S9M4R5_BRACR|nr:hypothetical protein F2Q70_00011341 [Brassica cretica]
MELGAVQVVAELVNRIFDSEKYEEFPLSLVEQFILLVLEVFCEIEADQESNSPAGGGLRTWFIDKIYLLLLRKGYTGPLSSSRSFEVRRSMALFIMKYHARYISGGTIRACSKAHYRSESVKFHWLLDFSSLGIVLVDILEESNSATELLSSLGIVLVDILEESNSATELLRFLGHMTRCFRGARSSFGSSSFYIRDRTRCHYWRRATS